MTCKLSTNQDFMALNDTSSTAISKVSRYQKNVVYTLQPQGHCELPFDLSKWSLRGA